MKPIPANSCVVATVLLDESTRGVFLYTYCRIMLGPVGPTEPVGPVTPVSPVGPVEPSTPI